MRLNFTGRKKIDKQHARVGVRRDGSTAYFELRLDLSHYSKLPSDARIFLEAYRKLILMRFDLGIVAKPTDLAQEQRALADFRTDVDAVKFRLKITQADGPEAGKLLAEADGLTAETADEGRMPLIQLVGADDLGQRPWELELVPSDPDLPTLRINNRIGGKQRGRDLTFRALVLPAVVSDVFTQLLETGVDDEESDHWTGLWARLATDVLALPDPRGLSLAEASVRDDWVRGATNSFCTNRHLVDRLLTVPFEGSAL